MNKILQKAFCLALTLELISFSPCSYSTVFAQNPTAKNVFGDRLLKNYTIYNVDESGETIYNYDFYYNDKGQLIEIKGAYQRTYQDTEGINNTTIDYTSGTIDGYDYDVKLVETNKENNLHWNYRNEWYLKIGSNNFIESGYLYKSSDSEVAEPYKTWQVVYNNDNQLEKIITTNVDNGKSYTDAFTYENGNIVYIEQYYAPATLEYSPSIANEDNIMEWQEFGCDWDEYPTWMYYAGLLGKPTKLLPTNCNFERNRSRYYT